MKMEWAEVAAWLAYAMIGAAVCTFVGLMFLEAPYGRYSKNQGWGPLIPPRIAWVVMESPNLIIPAVFISLGHNEWKHPRNAVLLSLYIAHYINRVIIYPCTTRGGKPMPLSVMLLALTFCTWNGTMQSIALCCIPAASDATWTDPKFLLGVLLWCAGFAINVHSDHVLANLRAPGETGYKIPQGGMFRFVSGANFFGEIVEWCGYALGCWSLPGLAFAVYVFSNIGPRGYQHHLWYKTKFEDYPKERKAVIPFVW